jgi:hypothetical protein
MAKDGRWTLLEEEIPSPVQNLTYPTTLSTHMLITVSPHTLAFPAITNSPVGEQTTDLSELNLFNA